MPAQLRLDKKEQHPLDRRDQMKQQISTSELTPHINCQPQWSRGDDMGLFCCYMTWEPSSHWFDYDKYSRVKYEVVLLLKLKIGQKLVRATGQWSQLQQKIYNTMAEKEKNKGVAMRNLVQTSTWQKGCGRTLTKLCINEHPQTSMNWSML